MNLRNWKHAALALAAVGLAACGGGSDNGGQAAASRGAIQGFGSIVVNGVSWRITNASLVIDDSTVRTLANEAQPPELQQGQVVTVRGSLDDNGLAGQATEIRFGEDFQGLVTAITPDGSGFTAVGIRVIVDGSTVFVNSAGAGRALANVAVGTRVEVSGVPDAGGAFRASHVKIEDGVGTLGDEVEVKGFVVAGPGASFGLALTPGGTAFLTVNPGGFATPAVGSYVEVKSNTAAVPGTPPSITLSRAVEVEDSFRGENGVRNEVEGIVLSGTLAEFVIGTTTVRTSSATTFRGVPDGSSAAAEFAIGTKIEAEGSFDGSVLNASRVKFKDAARIGGPAGSVTGTGFTLLGGSVTVVTDANTQFDEGNASLLSTGFVEVRGYKRSGTTSTVYAQRIRVRASSDRPFLQGVVEAESSPTLQIMGLSVTTSTSTEFQAEDGSGNDVPLVTANGQGAAAQAAFFDAIAPLRSIVKVKWDNGVPVTGAVREAEIEAEDD